MNAVAYQSADTDRPSLTVIDGGLAFRQQLEHQLPRLFPRALQLCRNPGDAQDLLQDTVERALRFEHHYAQGSNLKAWLNQILFSLFVTRCRSKSRERRVLDSLGSDPCAWPKSDPAPLMRGLTPRLRDAVQALPPAFAQVVLLVDVHELSYKEAAEQLDVPVGTIMSRLHRARRLLREALDDEAAA